MFPAPIYFYELFTPRERQNLIRMFCIIGALINFGSNFYLVSPVAIFMGFVLSSLAYATKYVDFREEWEK